MAKNLDLLLEEEESTLKVDKKERELNTVRLTEYALNKAYAYANLTCENFNQSLECGGFLIAPEKSKEHIATDVFLARDQEVSAGLFTVQAPDVIKAGREINEMGYKVLGWWHSHGTMSTFFSSIDDRGQMTLLNAISPINYFTESSEQTMNDLEIRTDGNKLILLDKNNLNRRIEMEADDPAAIAIRNLKMINNQNVGFAYGIVVNVPRTEQRITYSELAIRDSCSSCREFKDKSTVVPITLFEDSRKVDKDILMAEVKERVKPAYVHTNWKKPGKKRRGILETLSNWKNEDEYYSGRTRVKGFQIPGREEDPTYFPGTRVILKSDCPQTKRHGIPVGTEGSVSISFRKGEYDVKFNQAGGKLLVYSVPEENLEEIIDINRVKEEKTKLVPKQDLKKESFEYGEKVKLNFSPNDEYLDYLRKKGVENGVEGEITFVSTRGNDYDVTLEIEGNRISLPGIQGEDLERINPKKEIPSKKYDDKKSDLLKDIPEIEGEDFIGE